MGQKENLKTQTRINSVLEETFILTLL